MKSAEEILALKSLYSFLAVRSLNHVEPGFPKFPLNILIPISTIVLSKSDSESK